MSYNASKDSLVDDDESEDETLSEDDNLDSYESDDLNDYENYDNDIPSTWKIIIENNEENTEKFYASSSSEDIIYNVINAMLMKVNEFIEKNMYLIMNFRNFHSELNQSEFFLWHFRSDIKEPEILIPFVMFEMYVQKILRPLHKHFDSYQLNIFESLKKKCDELILKVDDVMRNEDEDMKQKILHEILHSIVRLLTDINYRADIGENFDQFRILCYQAAECYETDAQLWLELAKLEQDHKNFDKAIETLNRAIENVPDSERLWIKLAETEFLSGNENNVQEIIDRALISFADNGFEIEKSEWIKAVSKPRKRKNRDNLFIYLNVISIAQI